jgi:cytochrome P450
MPELAEELRLEDPSFFNEDPYPVVDRLLREAPVFYYEPLDMWVVSKHEDVRRVGRAATLFSSRDGILLNDFRYGEILKSFFPGNAENFAIEDPPRHDDLRKLMFPPFNANVVARIESVARELCATALNAAEPGNAFNWSELVAEPFPLAVIALLLGLPVEDAELLKEWSDTVISMSAATDADRLGAYASSLAPMGEYFEEKLAERRYEPRDDMLTMLDQARASGLISNETVHMMLSGIMTAGNETTRNTINGTIFALAEHPAEMARLAEDPSKVKRAVEEFLRWVTPVRGFGRTATEDTELGGTKIRAGQRVFMFFVAANRDPDAFERPGVFDVERVMTKPQLSFGFGQHACVGSALARMELRVLFEEVVSRFSAVTIDSGQRVDSRLINGWADVKVTFLQ